MVLGNFLAMFRWPSCREGTKRTADSSKSPMTFRQNVRTAPARTAQTGPGWKQTEMREPRAPKGMQDESRELVSATFCRPSRNAVQPEPAPASAPRREWLAKGQMGFARGRTPSRAGKALRSSVFPLFLHPQELPCGKKVSSLRKAVHFFAESDSVFSGKKRPPGRRNAPYKQFLHPFFNSPAPFCGGPSCH